MLLFSAYTIGWNLWLIGAFTIDGYSSAGNIISGKLLGAKDYKNLLKLGDKLLLYGISFGILLACIWFVFHKPIGWIFTQEPLVLEQFYTTFWIILLM